MLRRGGFRIAYRWVTYGLQLRHAIKLLPRAKFQGGWSLAQTFGLLSLSGNDRRSAAPLENPHR